MIDNAFWLMLVEVFFEPISYAAAALFAFQLFFWLLTGVYTLFSNDFQKS